MITVSDSFKTELENGNRNYLVKVDITLADSTVLPTITKDNLIDLSIEDAVSQDTKFTALGGAVINKAVINIDNSDENYSNYNFNNATATIQIGLQVNGTPEYVDRGVYIVDSVSPKGVGLELSCLDYMSKFDKSYTNSEIVYPATIQEVIEDACTICGVAFTGTYPDSDYVLTITPPVATFREVLSAIGQITGTFAHVDRQGQLYFSWFNTTLLNQAIDSNTKIDGVHYIENVIDNTYEKDNITIDGVRAYIINEESNEKFEYHYPSALADDSFCLNITGNPLIHGGNITEIINRVGPRIVGLTIRQTNCKHVNNPLIEAGDIAMVLYSVKNNTNAYYPIVITRTTFAINQAQETVCGVETLSENLDGRYSDTQLLREQTKKDTNDARKVATNYLSADTTGIMIADLADDVQTPSTATGRNVKIDNNSVDIRDGQNIIAQFGEVVQVGEDEESHLYLDYHSLQLIDSDGNSYLHVSDLKDAQGYVTFTEDHTYKSSASYINTDYTIYSIEQIIVNDSVELDYDADYTYNRGYTTISWRQHQQGSSPTHHLNDGDKITVTYMSTDKQTKAYTLGLRKANSTIGPMSFAEGYEITASGNYSHAEGYITTASGNYSHAEGYKTTANGYTSSHAEGYYTTASGGDAHAEGVTTTASGSASHAEGYITTASGSDAHAEGASTTAGGDWSHAEGIHTTASGSASHAEGFFTIASGNYSHAEGYYTTASGGYSHAEGYYTTASSDWSHAEGHNTTASGSDAHAEGIYTTASGSASHAGGYHTTAFGAYQTVIGKYNVIDDTYAFIIGNGTEDNARSNAFTVDWNGNVNIPSNASYQIGGVALDNRYVNKAGDTMSGALTNTSNYIRKMTGATRGTTPSATQYGTYEFTDSTGKRLAQVEACVDTGGNSRLHMYVLGHHTTSDQYGGFIITKSVGNTGNQNMTFNANTGVLSLHSIDLSGAGRIVYANNTGASTEVYIEAANSIGRVALDMMSDGKRGVWTDKGWLVYKTTDSKAYFNGMDFTDAASVRSSIGAINRAGDTMTANFTLSASNNTGRWWKVKNSLQEGSFYVDTAGNLGIWSDTKGKWVIRCTTSGQVLVNGGWTQIAQVQGTNSATYTNWSTSGYSEIMLMIWYSTSYLGTAVFPTNSIGGTQFEIYTGGGGNSQSTSGRRACAKVSNSKLTGVLCRVDGTDVTASSWFRLYAR